MVSGEVQVLKPPPSTAHSKVASCSGEEKLKVGVLSLVFSPSIGPESIDVSAPVRSTVKVRVAGVASGRLCGSTARTAKVCWPSPSGAVVWGEVQALKAPPSTAHSKVESFSLEVN